MRAELTLRNDHSPIIRVTFSAKTLEWLSSHDLVSYISTISKANHRNVNSGMIGVSLSENGSIGLKHDYRTVNGGTIDNAIAHFIELSEENYGVLRLGKQISMVAETDTLISLVNDDRNSGGGNITLYDKGYIRRYLLPGINPYAGNGICSRNHG